MDDLYAGRIQPIGNDERRLIQTYDFCLGIVSMVYCIGQHGRWEGGTPGAASTRREQRIKKHGPFQRLDP
jgi:hypothetical protein